MPKDLPRQSRMSERRVSLPPNFATSDRVGAERARDRARWIALSGLLVLLVLVLSLRKSR